MYQHFVKLSVKKAVKKGVEKNERKTPKETCYHCALLVQLCSLL